ncbi:hypothetical protein NFJ02_31g79930 [Pycnococcus provasolii]
MTLTVRAAQRLDLDLDLTRPTGAWEEVDSGGAARTFTSDTSESPLSKFMTASSKLDLTRANRVWKAAVEAP